MKYNINRRKLLVTSALSVLTPVVASNMSVAATPQTSKSDRSWDEKFSSINVVFHSILQFKFIFRPDG